MSRSRVPLKRILGLAGLALLGWILYLGIEFYDETVETRWSLEALRNPYLAAEQFLDRSEIGVVEVESLVNLKSLTGVSTLFISDANQVVSPHQLKQLQHWLEQGGHVIYTANAVAHEDDLLLTEYRVEVDWPDQNEDEEEKTLSESFREYNRQLEEGKTREEIAQSLARDTSLTIVDFGDDGGQLEAAFSNRRILLHPYIEGTDTDAHEKRPRSWAYSEYGVHLMQFDVGDGQLTLISDPTVWASYRIDDHDHAFLLWKLSAAGSSFAILRPVLQDSLWQLTVEHASELLIAAALLIAVWIWHLAYRFGRMVPRDLSRTRALGEHFSSISHYLWHRKHGRYLVQPLRQRVLRRASLALGEFSRADHERQMELLAERCDRTVDSVAKAMRETDFSEAGFVQTVKLLKHIEQSL